MAGKARVHELAKELGVSSKQVLSKLQDLGEYVKSASSTVEAPVARKLRDSMAAVATTVPRVVRAPPAPARVVSPARARPSAMPVPRHPRPRRRRARAPGAGRRRGPAQTSASRRRAPPRRRRVPGHGPARSPGRSGPDARRAAGPDGAGSRGAVGAEPGRPAA